MKLMNIRMHFISSILPLNLMLPINYKLQFYFTLPNMVFTISTITHLQTHNRSSPLMVIVAVVGEGMQCNAQSTQIAHWWVTNRHQIKTSTLHRLWWGKSALVTLISPPIDFKGSHGWVKLEYIFFFFINLHGRWDWWFEIENLSIMGFTHYWNICQNLWFLFFFCENFLIFLFLFKRKKKSWIWIGKTFVTWPIQPS